MNTRKISLWCFVLILILINTWSIVQITHSPKTSVKGIATKISPKPTPIPTPTFIPTPINQPSVIPTPTTKATTKTLTFQSKQYGRWYWHPELNKSQVWIGTDSAGKDIWSDNFPTPTFTPTPTPQKSSISNPRTSSNGTSSQNIDDIEIKAGSSINSKIIKLEAIEK